MSPVEEFILEQTQNIKPILYRVRELILSASPYIQEKMVYNIPFFYGKKRMFYLNPHKNGVELGFCYGYLMAEHDVLKSKNRSQVKTLSFYSPEDVQEETINPLIHEAILIDQVKK